MPALLSDLALFGYHSPGEAYQVVTRKEVAGLLKAAAEFCGIPQAKVSTHSLRRGGASMYAATGKVSEFELAKFGRWTSDAYKGYVYSQSESLNASLHCVPRWERN